jgi:4-carboxymuconolactone decarboxylase
VAERLVCAGGGLDVLDYQQFRTVLRSRRPTSSRRLIDHTGGEIAMDQRAYDKGIEVRTAVLGEEYVRAVMNNADEFSQPLQDLVTEYCWGAVWGRDGLPLKTRSMLNLAMISILNRPAELRTHLRGALNNGVTRDEIREIFLQVGIYAGVPAAVDSFRAAREVFAESEQD